MADIGITKYRARVIKENALPSNPGNPATNPVDPVNPPASGGGTGVNQFIQLTDTPATYSGATLNYARVNAGETGLEFRTPAQVLTDIGGIGGTIASGQVAFGTGSGTIGGDSGLTFNNILKRILVTSPTYDSILLSRTGSQNVAIGFETTIGRRYIGFDLTSNVFGITNSVLAFGSAPFRVNPSNGNIFTSGTVAVNTTSPTDTLDVNGTTRIRTINNLGSTPTEVLVPSATGVISKRTLSEFASDIGAVTITGTQTITGEKTFSNSLLIQEASAPILRLKTTNETQATINFRNIANEDEAGLQFDAGVGKFSLLTRENNCDIEIAPHGTGSILLPNVPSGTGDVLMLNGSGEVVKGVSSFRFLQTKAGVSKTTPALNSNVTDTFGEECESMFDNSVLIGSRLFDSSVECPANSVYEIEGKVRVNTGGGTPAPTFSVRMNFFGYDENVLRPEFWFLGATSSGADYIMQFNIRIAFTDTPNNSMSTFIIASSFEETSDTITARGDVTSPQTLRTISGSSTLDILLGGTQATIGQILSLKCTQLK